MKNHGGLSLVLKNDILTFGTDNLRTVITYVVSIATVINVYLQE